MDGSIDKTEDMFHLRSRVVECTHFSAMFVGDVGFGEHYAHHPRCSALQHRPHDHAFEALAPLIQGADVAVANLEAPLSARPNPAFLGRKNQLAYSNPLPAVDALEKAGFTAVSLANDHALDCGRTGLAETMERLSSSGIASFGAGETAAQAASPYIAPFKSGHRDRALVVFGCCEYREHYDQNYKWYTNRGAGGVAPLSPRNLARQIAQLRPLLPDPLFVVFPHWGKSYEPITAPQHAAARALVTAGADLVIGHGSHMMQPLEMIEGTPVVYGLGNCVWNTPGRYAQIDAPPLSQMVALRSDPGGRLSLRLYPIVTDNMVTGFQTRPVTPEEFEAWIPPTPYDSARSVAGGHPYVDVPLA